MKTFYKIATLYLAVLCLFFAFVLFYVAYYNLWAATMTRAENGAVAHMRIVYMCLAGGVGCLFLTTIFFPLLYDLTNLYEPIANRRQAKKEAMQKE